MPGKPHFIIMLTLLLLVVAAAPAQKTYRAATLVHKDGRLEVDTIELDFIQEDGAIHHPLIDSLHVYKLDSVSFAANVPEFQELHGTPEPLDWTIRGNTLELEPYGKEFYAVFAVHHTLEALSYYKKHFGGLVDFPDKKKYRELELYLGDYINCSPEQYILNPGARISPTIIYHEVGHRAFCQLDDTLAIGNVFSMLHNGLMEYFTASIANHPVIGEGMLHPPLTRDASKKVQYPEDTYYYREFLDDLRQVVSDTMQCYEALKKYYALNKERADRCTTRIAMTHQTGMLITHPLWEIRQKAGRHATDSLVVRSMKQMYQVVEKRDEFLKKKALSEKEPPEWYDFLYSLYLSDRHLYGGENMQTIRTAFKKAGYSVHWIKTP